MKHGRFVILVLGETTINEAICMGRSMNSGMYLMSQGIDDLGTEKYT